MKNKSISINVADLSSVNDPVLPMLLYPVIKGRTIINAEPKRIDGHAVLLDCDRERALAIVSVIRMRYGKNKIRIYDGKKRV